MATTKTKAVSRLDRALPYILIVAGFIGFAMAFLLMQDKIAIAKNPNYIPVCNINPIISCGKVVQTKQASAFGFPNVYIGLGAFPILFTIGFALLAEAKFKRWFWLGLQAGTIFGVCFVHWLFFEVVYRIHALCPFCIVVWIVTITAFWYTLLYNLRNGNIKTLKRLTGLVAFMQRHHLDILITWFLIITALILHHFWYYFGPH